MADDFAKDDASGARSAQEEARVRVMSDRERTDYDGVTLEETSDGHAYETPREEEAGVPMLFSRQRAREIYSVLHCGRYLGRIGSGSSDLRRGRLPSGWCFSSLRCQCFLSSVLQPLSFGL